MPKSFKVGLQQTFLLYGKQCLQSISTVQHGIGAEFTCNKATVIYSIKDSPIHCTHPYKFVAEHSPYVHEPLITSIFNLAFIYNAHASFVFLSESYLICTHIVEIYLARKQKVHIFYSISSRFQL